MSDQETLSGNSTPTSRLSLPEYIGSQLDGPPISVAEQLRRRMQAITNQQQAQRATPSPRPASSESTGQANPNIFVAPNVPHPTGNPQRPRNEYAVPATITPTPTPPAAPRAPLQNAVPTTITPTPNPTAPPTTFPIVCRLVTPTLSSIANPADPRTQFLNLSHVLVLLSSYPNVDLLYTHISQGLARSIQAMFPSLTRTMSPQPELRLLKLQTHCVYAIWSKGNQPEPSLVTQENLQRTLRLLKEVAGSSALYVVVEVEWARRIEGQVEELRAPVDQGTYGQC